MLAMFVDKNYPQDWTLPHSPPENCLSSSPVQKNGKLMAFQFFLLLLLLQPAQSYMLVSLESVWLTQNLKLLSTVFSQISQELNNSHIISPSPAQQPGKQMPGDQDNTTFSSSQDSGPLKGNIADEKNFRKFHSFIYPYLIFELQHVKFGDLHELMTQAEKNQSHSDNYSQFGSARDQKYVTANKGLSSSESSTFSNSSVIISQMFLFEKIKTCVLPKACQYISLMPNNMALVVENSSEWLNLFRVGQSEFIIQSTLSFNQSSQEAKDSVELKKTEVYFYSLHLNTFIFSKMNEQMSLLSSGYDQLFRRYKIFEMPENENSRWDFATNGSSFRFVKLRKISVPGSVVGSFKQEKQDDNKTAIPLLLRRAMNVTPSSSIWGQGKQENKGQFINVLHMVEHSISVYQESKHYFAKFYSSEDWVPSLTYDLPNARTKRNSMIGATQSNQFFLFFTSARHPKLISRVFLTDLHELQLIGQIAYGQQVDRNQNQVMGKIRAGVNSDSLFYMTSGPSSKRIEHSLIAQEVGGSQSETVGCNRTISYSGDSKTGHRILKIGEEFIVVCLPIELGSKPAFKCEIFYSACHFVYGYIILADQDQSWTIEQNRVWKYDTRIRLYVGSQSGNNMYLGLKLSRLGFLKHLPTMKRMDPFIQNKNDIGHYLIEEEGTIYKRMMGQLEAEVLKQGTQSLSSAKQVSQEWASQMMQPIISEAEEKSEEIDLQQLELQERQIFLEANSYLDKDQFKYEYACKLMESKLKPMLPAFWNESDPVQSSNCHLVWNENQENLTSPAATRSLKGISFRTLKSLEGRSSQTQQGATNQTQNWSICRVAIDSGHQNLAIEPVPMGVAIDRPYLLFRCSMYHSALSKCYYHEWVGNKPSPLPQNSKSVLFIINQGQTYDLKITDLNSVEMDSIAESFFIIFLALSVTVCVFGCVIVCRPLYFLFCIYLGLARPQADPRFRYPLNWLELRLKIHLMLHQGLIKQTVSQHNNGRVDGEERDEEETDDCIFCLEPKSAGEAIIEVYCKHTYHEECFQEWIRQESSLLSCPICKRKLNLQSLVAYREQAE